MAENFFALSATDRNEALAVAASQSGRPAHILEKDAWVVWTLSALFRSPFAQHLIFKGGTSLSKVYRAIDSRKTLMSRMTSAQ
jgi:predicted nucleotidyltransferase component of viral defense system